MKKLCSNLVLLSVLFMLSGCGRNMSYLKDEKPVFNLEEWFVGKFKASGGFFSRSGDLKRRFTMTLEGRREGELTLLNEVLTYTDGEVTTRTYKIKKIRDNFYEATAEGVVGVATIESAGNALHWKYRLKQAIGGSDWTLSFDDWMYLVDEKTMMDRAEVSKFGIRVGEVYLTAIKE